MIAQSLLPEFDHEFGLLRKTLERVPEDRPDYTPHAKSMTLSKLAGHLAEIPMWLNVTLETDELDFATSNFESYVMTTRAHLLETLDANVARARAALAAASDAEFMRNWTLRAGEKVFLTMPKVAVVRGFVFSHMIHHRAQLGVYLRMNEVPLPSLYGPSADEGNM